MTKRLSEIYGQHTASEGVPLITDGKDKRLSVTCGSRRDHRREKYETTSLSSKGFGCVTCGWRVEHVSGELLARARGIESQPP
jgi:hypothetical protein